MKHRGKGIIRKSVSAKLNIMMVLIVLIVAGSLMIISNRAFRRAAFRSAERKLNNIQIANRETIIADLNHFQQIFETDAFQDARAKCRTASTAAGGQSGLAVWLAAQPSWRQFDSAEHESSDLLTEWLNIAQWADTFWETHDLYSVCIEVQRNGKTWRIYGRTLNEDDSMMLKIDCFGEEVAWYPTLSAGSFRSAAQTRSGEKDLYIRCLQDKLDGGAEYCIWISFDMTDEISEYRDFLMTNLLSVLGLTVLINGIAVLILRRQVSRPIRRIAQATRAFLPEADGTYSADSVSTVEICSEDELGELSRDIRSMQEQIVENTGNLARMTAERERISTEMNLAREIQASALPGDFPAFPERREFGLYASMRPAKEVGGDFYDFFLIDDDHLALVIADVSGKGIPAALFMMKTMTLIRNQLMTGSDPASALDRVNLRLCEHNPAMMFVTVWAAVVEISTGKVLVCNAGHENPGLRRAGRGFELLKYRHGVFLGVSKKAKHENRVFELQPGDCVFVYTDGVTEATNGAGKRFGEERLAETLNRYPDAEPEALIRHVRGAVDLFAGGAEQFDDITMLCFRYFGIRNRG